jgi:cytosine permease
MATIPTPGTEVVPKPWQTGLAPVYIGMFLWVAFFDQLGRRALPIGGLAWSVLGAAVAGPLAYLLLFRAPASWGHREGKPLKVLASSTFGVQGATMVPGLLLGIAQIALFSVAVGYAIELTFQGLVLTRLVEPQSLRPGTLGGATIKSPLYLGTALFWAIATALVSLRFIRWIGFLMQFFPIFPAAMLGVAMMATLTGLRDFRPTGTDPLNPAMTLPVEEASLRAFLLTLQWVFAFSSMAGVMGADWGSGSVSIKDVRLGGWVGLAFAPAIVASLALIAVAGYQGMREASDPIVATPTTRTTIADLPARGQMPSTGTTPGLDAPPHTFRLLLIGRFDPRIGGLMLLTFGLASLAPAVYSSFMFGQQFKALGPGVSRLTWTMMGTCTAWLLIVGGWFDRTEVAFNLLGAAFAPVAGAMTADYRRHRGRWPGARVGANPAGLISWGVGLVVGLAPTLGRTFGSERAMAVQPAALWAFVAAYLTYELLALVRLESAKAKTGEF